MKITKITINNFKSINNLELDVKAYDNSYTTIMLGINEVGKSNILKAISLFSPSGDYLYHETHNQKDDDNKDVSICFDLSFEESDKYHGAALGDQSYLSNNDFKIKNIKKNVFLKSQAKNFAVSYTFDVELKGNFFYANLGNGKIELKKANSPEGTLEPMTLEKFRELCTPNIIRYIKNNEPSVSFWEPSPAYLISADIDLHAFSGNPDANIPLKNIFALAGFDTVEKIRGQITTITTPHIKSKLESKLSDAITSYINGIWQHKIEFVADIEGGRFSISVKDAGKENKHDRHPMNARSDGFRQFILLILSLSVEAKKLNLKNRLILIDEP
ncbi:MAG: AAA family ATPase, partial [Campylobacterales bacterium]|nr:AAA family ATPase [Campylobacterales bacterium]